MMKLRPILGLVLLALALLAAPRQSAAQSPITAEVSAENNFPNGIIFRIKASSSAGEITEARVSYAPTGGRSRGSAPLREQPAPTVEGSVELDRRGDTLVPGSVIEYSWRVRDSAGNELTTDPQTITYFPPGFDWQEASRENVTFVWYEGSEAWGESVAEYSLAALRQIESDLGVSVTTPLRIVAFADSGDFHEANPTLQSWVGGFTRSDAGITVQIISADPDNQDWMRTVIAHELAHLVFDAATPGMLAPLPNWMSEGLAMYSEPGDHADDRARVEAAARDGKLYRLSELRSESFGDHSQVSLGYAMGWHIVDFLVSDCGKDGLSTLIAELNTGKTLDDALMVACGYDEQGLYNKWYTRLTGSPPPTAPQAVPSPEGTAPALPSVPEVAPPPVAAPASALPAWLGPALLFGGCGLGLLGMLFLVVLVVALRRA